MSPSGFLRAFWRRILLVVVLLDASFPGGVVNRVLYGRHWFPTNLTGLFAAALSDPAGAGATLLVSASTPFFWVLLAATVVFSRDDVRRKSFLLPLILSLLFFLTEFLLPWWGENGAPGRFLDLLFPVVPRGQGRAYGMAYLYASPFFLFIFFHRARARRADGQASFIRVK